MRDVEALDALREFRQAHYLLQFFLNLLRVGLKHTKALVVRLLRVVPGKIDERAFIPALRNENMNPCGAGALACALLGEQILECLPILKIDRDVEITPKT